MSEENTSPTTTTKPKMVAVIQIRGNINIERSILDTMEKLCLFNRNYCSIHKATPSILGMIRKCKDYVTWGEVSEEVVKKLLEKRAEPNPKDKSKTKKFFRLNSPKKGYGRKGIKVPFVNGGALGNRGDKMNDLIERMI